MKKQTWITGSQNPITETITDEKSNLAWERFEVLKAGDLDGILKKDSEQLHIVSQEICNFIEDAGVQVDPTQDNQLLTALNVRFDEIKTSSLQFKGYVNTTAPSSATYSLVIGNMWINADSMPTTFPVLASSIKIWDGENWVESENDYTPQEFHTFRDITSGEGFYWFGGAWKVMSTDLSTEYFTLNQDTGLWEISETYDNTLVHTTKNETIEGHKTFTSDMYLKDTTHKLGEDTGVEARMISWRDSSNTRLGRIHTAFETETVSKIGIYAGSTNASEKGIEILSDGTTSAPTPAYGDNSTKIATTAWVTSNTVGITSAVKAGTILPYAGTVAPTGYLPCNGSEISREDYADLFSVISTNWGEGDGETTFNLPDFTNGNIPVSATSDFGTSVNGNIPNHYHNVSTMGNNNGNFVATNTAGIIDRANTTDLGIGRRNWNGNNSGGSFVSETTAFTGAIITTVGKQISAVNNTDYGVYTSSATKVIAGGYNTMYIIKY